MHMLQCGLVAEISQFIIQGLQDEGRTEMPHCKKPPARKKLSPVNQVSVMHEIKYAL